MPQLSPTHWSVPRTVAALDASGLRSRLAWAVQFLEERGVSMPAQCRARNALRALEHLDAGNQPGSESGQVTRPPDAGLALAYHATAWELFLIAYAASLCDGRDHPFTPAKLAQIVRGPDQIEGRDTSARNLQFELTLATRFCLGNVRVFDGEPDLRIQFGTEIVGVAAKRITSGGVTQLKAAIKKAVDQIGRSGLRGIIAINLEHRLDEMPATLDGAEMLAFIDSVFDTTDDFKAYFENDHGVLGVLTHAQVQRPTLTVAGNGLPEIDAAGAWRRRCYYASGAEQHFGEEFFAQWQRALSAHLLYVATTSG